MIRRIPSSEQDMAADATSTNPAAEPQITLAADSHPEWYKDGVIYQHDLGDQTPAAAAAIKEINPTPEWKEVQ